MKKEAIALSLLIAFSILYFDWMFYNGFDIAKKFDSEIQKTLLEINKLKATATDD